MSARINAHRLLLLLTAVSMSFGVVSFGAVSADEPPANKPEVKGAFELHQWGVWLADPALAALNSREHFTTSLPLSVDTTRPRRVKGAQTTAPITVVTF